MHIRKTLVTLFVIGSLFGASSSASTKKCGLLLTSLRSLNLLGQEQTLADFTVSHDGLFAQLTELESRYLGPYDRNGLLAVLKSPVLTNKMLEHFVRLGLLEASPFDTHYVPFKLVAENKEISVLDLHADAIINQYLHAKKIQKKIRITGFDPLLRKLSERDRLNYLYWQTLKILSTLDEKNATSREALRAAFLEMARLNDKTNLSLENLEAVLSSLEAYGTFIPKKIGIWEPVEELLKELPFFSPTICLAKDCYERTVGKGRVLKTETFEIGQSPKNMELVSGSLRIAFVNRDPYNYQIRAEEFFRKYVQGNGQVYAPQFIKDLAAAYPEFGVLLLNGQNWETLTGATGGYLEKGPFGPGSFDVYKVAMRSALVIALLRQDKSSFPNLTGEQLAQLHHDFVKDTELSVVKMEFEQFDAWMAFLMIDTIGRSTDEFISAMDKEHGIREKVGANDYERRVSLLLKKYKLSSYSFARLANEEQERIMSHFEIIFRYNAGQVIQMEAGPLSLKGIQSKGWRNIAPVFYRSLLSFAALPASEGRPYSLMTSKSYENWKLFARHLYDVSESKQDSAAAYREYLQAQAAKLGFRIESSVDFVFARLAAIFQITNENEFVTLQEVFRELPAKVQRTLILYLSERPILMYDTANLFSVIKANHKSDGVRKNFELALQTLARIYSTLDSNSEFRETIHRNPGEEVRIIIRPILNSINQGDVNIYERLRVERRALAFIISMP